MTLDKKQHAEFMRAKNDPKRFFHLTAIENVPSILEKGIVIPGDDSYVFLYTHRFVEETIARSQVYLNEYAVFEIDSSYGAADLCIRDDVGEFSAAWQWMCDTSIPPQFIKHIDTCKVDLSMPAPFWIWANQECFDIPPEETIRQYRQFAEYNKPKKD